MDNPSIMTGGIKYMKENQATSSRKEGYFPENSATIKKQYS
jgi:hypothetical protein